MTHTVLVVDDDAHIRDVIRFALEKAGLATLSASNGQEALAAFDPAKVDLIVLDINMPEMDGLDVCRNIRKKSDTPILFVSSRDEELDRIIGLELGGDDYVTKPFSPRELVARVKVILKRAKAAPAAPSPSAKAEAPLAHGKVVLDRVRHLVSFGDQSLTLTATEFAILETFLARPQHLRDRASLMDQAYGGEIYVSDRTIDSHIRHIRLKFQKQGCASVIETVHGVGYKLGSCL